MSDRRSDVPPPTGGASPPSVPPWGPGAPPPVPPPQQPRRRGLSPLAIAGIVVAAVALVSIPVAVGAALLMRSGDDDRKAAPAHSAVPAPGGSTSDDPTDEPTLKPGEVYIDDLRTGECFGRLDPEVVDAAGVVKRPCAAAHEAEMIGVPSLADRPWPGDAGIDAEAYAMCRRVFRSYVGIDAGRSRYGVEFAPPAEEDWTEGDRRVFCYAFSNREPLTRSVKGTRR